MDKKRLPNGELYEVSIKGVKMYFTNNRYYIEYKHPKYNEFILCEQDLVRIKHYTGMGGFNYRVASEWDKFFLALRNPTKSNLKSIRKTFLNGFDPLEFNTMLERNDPKDLEIANIWDEVRKDINSDEFKRLSKLLKDEFKK